MSGTPASTLRALRLAGTLGAMLFCVWAGIRVHAGRKHLPAAAAAPPAETDPGADVLTTADLTSPAPPTIPDTLPDFVLSDRDGKPTAIATWRGKSLILNFWATWCAPCRREIPLLQALAAEWSDRDVQVVGVAVDRRDPVLAYADSLKIGYPVLIGEQDALDVITALGMDSPAFPFTVFTDDRGQVVALYVGELHRPQATLILSQIDALNHGRVALADARRAIEAGLAGGSAVN